MDISVRDDETMNYVQFISLVRQIDRSSRGEDSIRRILPHGHVDRSSSALEIGSNTGVISQEVVRTSKCKAIGIDEVSEAVGEAKRVSTFDTDEIQSLVNFKAGSAYDIPFDDPAF